MSAPSNRYTPAWFATFLAPITPAQTAHEIAFVAQQLPLPAYRRVLDLCCGSGRHARALAARGYQVTGVDRDAGALAVARAAGGPPVTYVAADMRDLHAVPGPYDAVVNLWQSFGYFDATTNTGVLRALRDLLTSPGRLILDVYHRGFFAQTPGERRFTHAGRTIHEQRHLDGDRLHVTLDYGPDLPPETFDWQVYTPEELIALAASLDLTCLVACSGFDAGMPPTPAAPRMQLVFGHRAG